MAKESPNTKAKGETAFQRFQRLAKKLIAVPKAEADKAKPQIERSSRKSGR